MQAFHQYEAHQTLNKHKKDIIPNGKDPKLSTNEDFDHGLAISYKTTTINNKIILE